MKLNQYLEHLTDENWHTLRELIEFQQGATPLEKEEEISTALECAIAYLEWSRYGQKHGQTLIESITRRIGN